MKQWLFLFIPLLCVACQISPTNKASDTAVSTIVTEEIEYSLGEQAFTGYLAYDKAITTPRPGVLVVHEWWGHNDYARTRAEQLAGLGYTALALDMYGTGKVTEHPSDAMAFMKEATKNPEAVKARFLIAKSILEQQPSTDPEKIAAIGYCFGGGVVLNMARAGVDLDGVASFHGSLAPTFSATPGEVATKVIVFNGADDSMVSSESIDAFKGEMQTAGIDFEFINYPGAKHSFTNPGATAVGEQHNMPLAYNQAADEQSWEKLQLFFAELWPEN